MSRGWVANPKIDITITIRDLTLESAPLVDGILGRALKEVKQRIELTDPTRVVEAAIEIGKREPNIVDVQNTLIRKAMEACDGNIQAAAKMAGIGTRSLYRWLINQGKEVIR